METKGKAERGRRGSRRQQKKNTKPISKYPPPQPQTYYITATNACLQRSLLLSFSIPNSFSFVIESTQKAPDITSGEWFGVGFDGWCKYCTTTMDPKSFINAFVILRLTLDVMLLCTSFMSSHFTSSVPDS